MVKDDLGEVLIPVALGLGAITVGGWVVYQIFVAPVEAKKDELKMWVDEWLREYEEYIQDGAINVEEQQALDFKTDMIEKVSEEIMAFGWTPEKIYGLVFTAGVTLLGLYVGKRAFDYFITRRQQGEIKTVHGYIAAMGSAINIDLAEQGFPTLATAAQTSLQNWVNTYHIPLMQNQISYYQALIPYLTGMELLWAQYMITALQFEISIGIAAILSAAWLLI